jgi:hypothetical protein
MPAPASFLDFPGTFKMTRKKREVPTDLLGDWPVEVASGKWRGKFGKHGTVGEAVAEEGIPLPPRRTARRDLWWLLDELKPEQSVKLGRGYDSVRVDVAAYRKDRKDRGLAEGTFKCRRLDEGTWRSRVWRVK